MGVKTFNNVSRWLDASYDIRKPGFNKINLYFLRELKQVSAEFATNNVILHFLVVHAGVTDCYPMYWSGVKQRKFIGAVINELKEKQCYPEDIKIFKSTISRFYERIRYVSKIAQENIRLTEWYPFFEATGWDRFVDMAFDNNGGEPEAQEKLLAEATEWNKKHKDLVRAHLEAIKGDIEIRDRARQQREEDRKAQREAAKMLRKAEQDEIKEMKHYAEAYRKREKKIDKSFERYFK